MLLLSDILIPISLQIRNLIPGDIYLEEPISCYQQDENSAFDEYYACVNDQPKIVHVYRVQANNKEQMMQVCYSLFMSIYVLIFQEI